MLQSKKSLYDMLGEEDSSNVNRGIYTLSEEQGAGDGQGEDADGPPDSPVRQSMPKPLPLAMAHPIPDAFAKKKTRKS